MDITIVMKMEDEMMKKKNSKFWLFIFSFIPGAGEMYMGFMKMGLSLMLAFMLSIAVTAFTHIDVLSVICITIYIYCFFHAHNVRGMDDDAFMALEDKYLFGFDNLEAVRFRLDSRGRLIVAVLLIVVGVIMMINVGFSLLLEIFGWDNEYLRSVYYFVRDEAPRFLIGIAIIWGGVRMLRGQKAENAEKYIEINVDNNNNAEQQASGKEE